MSMIIFYVFLAAESESQISFSPTRLYLDAYELYEHMKYFLETVTNCHTFDHF